MALRKRIAEHDSELADALERFKSKLQGETWQEGDAKSAVGKRGAERPNTRAGSKARKIG